MSQDGLGVLHTKSSYAPAMPSLPLGAAEDVKQKQLMSKIDILKSKEDAFAQKFGFSNLNSFIKGAKAILNQNPKDLHALQQFSSANLRKHLMQFRKKTGELLKGQKIQLIFKTDKSNKQIENILNSSGNTGDIKWTMISENTHMFDLNWDTSTIKNLINKLFSKQFKTQSENIDRLVQFITSDVANLINIGVGEQGQSIQDFLIDNNPSPFAQKKEDIANLKENNPELLQKLKNKIEVFLYTELCAGASADFISAVRTIMGQKINSLIDWSFFMGGDGWVTQAVGAFGELQTAIFLQYIGYKTHNYELGAKLVDIIGDKTNFYGQQFHTDIELFNKFGIQVKNYSGDINQITGATREIAVNLHPTEIATLQNGEGLVDYIVNMEFNTDIPSIPDSTLNDFFKAHASELLNFDFNSGISDQVVLYMVGGHLMPGSEILYNAFQTQTIQVRTELRGKNAGNDEYFNEPKTGWHLKFIEWWRSNSLPPTAGDFSPTEKNNIGAWDRYVSISTKFTYSALFGEAYRIF